MRKERLKYFWGILIIVLANITTPFSYAAAGVDEMAYVAQAEFIAGINWSDVMATMTYHSFGCAVIPGLIIKGFGSTILAYRFILFHNSILVVICYFLICKIVSEIAPHLNKNLTATVSFFITLYSSNLGYSNSLNTECYVTLGYLVISCILINYIRRPDKKWLILLGVCSVYEMAVHQRTIGILMAVVIVLFSFLLKQKKVKDLLVFCIVLGICLFVFFLYKNYSQGAIWQNSELGSENDFSSIVNSNMFERLGKREFWTGLFLLSIGRIWYLGAASWGMILFGFGKMIKNIFEKDKNETERFLNLFWMISFVLCWGIALYNSYIPAQIYHVILGRYMDALTAPFLIIGFLSFISNKNDKRVWSYIIVAFLITGIITSSYADYVSQTRNVYQKADNLGIYIVNSDTYSQGLFLRMILMVILLIILAGSVALLSNSKKTFLLFLAFFWIFNALAFDYDVISNQKRNKIATVDFSKELKNITEEIGYFPEGTHYESRLKYLNPDLRFVRLNKNECVDGQTDYIMVVNDMYLEEKTMDRNCYSVYAVNDYLTIYKYEK